MSQEYCVVINKRKKRLCNEPHNNRSIYISLLVLKYSIPFPHNNIPHKNS